jgi:hypothetical protein
MAYFGEISGPSGGPGGLAGVIGGHGKMSAPKPFAREIFLIDTHIAGTTHIKGVEEICGKLGPGDRLDFFREPKNEFDKNAIVIRNTDGSKIGYVPMKQNEILARLMDAGKLLYGVIEAKESMENWLKIEIQIYLRD